MKAGKSKTKSKAGKNKAKNIAKKSTARKHLLSYKTGRVSFRKTTAAPAASRKTSDADRVATDIPGLDVVMGGGFEKCSTNMIAGGAGSGKSIFGVQFLVNGATKFNEPGVYLTFEEGRKKLQKHMQKFGWELEKLEQQKKIAVIEYMPEHVEKLIEEGGGIIENTISKIKAKRIVIDSLTAFTMLFKGDLERRKACHALFEMLQKWGCTTLLIAEYEPDYEKHQSTLMEFEADGVILLYNTRKGDYRERSLEILKLRGTHHSSSIFLMKITDSGIVVFPEDAVF